MAAAAVGGALGGGSKGSTQSGSSTINLPPEITEAAIANLERANEVSALGYTPYMGPTVAGFTPQQMNAFQNINRAAGAFGMSNVDLDPNMTNAQIGHALTGIQPPNAFAGGFSGYSGAPLYQAALEQMPPAQRALIESFFINPQTGAAPTNPAITPPQFGAAPPVEEEKKVKKDSADLGWWEEKQRLADMR